MNFKQLKTFFGWCSVINFAFLFLIGIIYLFFNDMLFGIFGNFATTTREWFDQFWLLVLGIWKMCVWVFFIIPYIAMVMMEKKAA
ncbi:MAG: hypothetical protein H6567_04870 [Lewinellaceae bacterium]|nr:hypothetical protein [Lewinellaceae bacterium]